MSRRARDCPPCRADWHGTGLLTFLPSKNGGEDGHPPTINCMDLAALLTEQANPASAHIDKLSTEEMLRVIGEEDRKVAEAVAAEIPRIALAVEGIVDAFRNGGRLFYIGAGTSGRLGVLDAAECPPTFNVPPDLVQGIIAGGEAALSRATETTEDDPAIGARDLQARGFRAKRRALRHCRQRPDALCAGRDRRGESAERADDRDQLHAGFGSGAAERRSRLRR